MLGESALDALHDPVSQRMFAKVPRTITSWLPRRAP